MSYVLAALQAGARGTHACINAASTVSGIIGDLDTTIMFASAGTLNPEGNETFADQRSAGSFCPASGSVLYRLDCGGEETIVLTVGGGETA